MTIAIDQLRDRLATAGRTILSGVPQGFDALVLAETAEALGPRPLVHVALDDQRMASLIEALEFFAPGLEIARLPAWDCLPYDRVSPAAEVAARRLAALARLAQPITRPLVVLTTVNAVLQRVPARQVIAAQHFEAAPGQRVDTEKLQSFLAQNGFSRTGTVVDRGDFAVRGGIIDVFPPGANAPVRLDFFGDALESIRSFDPQSQRTTGTLRSFSLAPASEVLLTEQAIGRFRTAYAQAFGGMDINDPLYESIVNGRRYQGLEHWLPLFHDRLDTIFDHIGDAVISFDAQADEAVTARRAQIEEFHTARVEAQRQETFGAPPYKPLPPQSLYLIDTEWAQALADHTMLALTPFESPDSSAISFNGKRGANFAAERAEAGRNVYEAVRGHVNGLRAQGKRVAIASWTEGSRDRLEGILKDHEVSPLASAASWDEVQKRDRQIVSLIVLGIEDGFETATLAVISEQDILGDRLVRRGRKSRKPSDFISELSALAPGDLVVHVDHGIGRFEGLRTIEVQGAPHDCLFMMYAGNDRLFLPVENIELLSRYGSDEQGVQLDRLGGGA